MFAAFLDLKGAYDNVDRNLLMLTLLSLGLPHYFVLLLCEMYKYVKLVVRVAGKCSTPVQSLLGLKQGCVLSPKLFSLYLNDANEFFVKNNAPMISIDLLKLCLLLFADDIVLLRNKGETATIIRDYGGLFGREEVNPEHIEASGDGIWS